MTASQTPICYLCSQPISPGQLADDDHCPPKQFYPKALRTDDLQLLTLRTHKSCNRDYGMDEEYFVSCLGILAKDTNSGQALTWDISRRSERPAGQRLGQRILSHFNEAPGGIHLPAGRIALEYEGNRIARVLWKIVRGLFFHENGRCLPDDTPCKLRILSTGEEPPPEFQLVRDTESKGRYGTIFDYKTFIHPNLLDFHYWAMLLWSEIIVIVGFHDPACSCEQCLGVSASC